MWSQADWEDEEKGMLKAEVKRQNMTNEQLAEIGVQDSACNIINKINRGSFSAMFFVQCLKVPGCSDLRLDGSHS